MFSDPQTEWRINDVERKAEQAVRELYQIESLRSDVGRLEHSLREARAEVDGLRSELHACLQRLDCLEQNPNA
jgi:predicted  nucleic acid-binding Zn-ribbon protein